MGVLVTPTRLTRSAEGIEPAIEESDLIRAGREAGMLDFDLVFGVDNPSQGQLITRWPDLDSARKFSERINEVGMAEGLELGESSVLRSAEMLERGD